MNTSIGQTRSAVETRYAVLAPEGLQPSFLPGWQGAICHVAVSPALGSRFSLSLVQMGHDGQCAGNTGVNEYFLYLLEGTASAFIENRGNRLEAGNFIFLPSGRDVQIKSTGPGTRVAVFQKQFQPLPGEARPGALVSHEREVKSQALAGAEGVKVQALVPELPGFDVSVQLITLQPGASLPAAATTLGERCGHLVRGQGIARFNRDWHPLEAKDTIWTAPYCPFWFAALGKSPAVLLCCMDVNRDPM